MEHISMDQIRQELRRLESDFTEVKRVLHEVHAAIVGNPITKDGGLTARLIDAEERLEELYNKFLKTEKRFEERLVENEKRQIKYNLMTAVMWASIGGVLMAVFLYLLKK